jgi:hypothetical protein
MDERWRGDVILAKGRRSGVGRESRCSARKAMDEDGWGVEGGRER